VILYELLSGARPFETKGKSFEEIVADISETEPFRPSSVVRRPSLEKQIGTSENNGQRTKGDAQPATGSGQNLNLKLLRGDLDNIILKALRKEPVERCGSVEQLAEDISRFLQGLPVLARPQTFKYRFGKFVRRHKAVVFAAALVLVSLVGGISVASRQALRCTARARKSRPALRRSSEHCEKRHFRLSRRNYETAALDRGARKNGARLAGFSQ
jgi:serine/threonine protein kinase